jgi:hypothetical protein
MVSKYSEKEIDNMIKSGCSSDRGVWRKMNKIVFVSKFTESSKFTKSSKFTESSKDQIIKNNYNNGKMVKW